MRLIFRVVGTAVEWWTQTSTDDVLSNAAPTQRRHQSKNVMNSIRTRCFDFASFAILIVAIRRDIFTRHSWFMKLNFYNSQSIDTLHNKWTMAKNKLHVIGGYKWHFEYRANAAMWVVDTGHGIFSISPGIVATTIYLYSHPSTIQPPRNH